MNRLVHNARQASDTGVDDKVVQSACWVPHSGCDTFAPSPPRTMKSCVHSWVMTQLRVWSVWLHQKTSPELLLNVLLSLHLNFAISVYWNSAAFKFHNFQVIPGN